MTKHTPGPWKAIQAVVCNEPERAMVAKAGWGGKNVADCGEYSEETSANATLCAAAPDMKSALEEIMIWARKGAGIPEEQLESIRKVAQAAIAKVKGE